QLDDLVGLGDVGSVTSGLEAVAPDRRVGFGRRGHRPERELVTGVGREDLADPRPARQLVRGVPAPEAGAGGRLPGVVEPLGAAGRLFAAAGYAATAVDEIAAEAGVSRETIFKAFGSKREVLRLWVEREVAGPEEPVPIQQQTWVSEMREALDQQTQLETAVAAVCRIHDRSFELRSEEHTSELQSRGHLVCRLLLEKKK